MSNPAARLREQLFHEILMARQRVYAVGKATPLHRIEPPGVQAEVFIKREDISAIHAYKWRGAYNRMCLLSERERGQGVVTASAGNHAQGVAMAARRLETPARVYMPISTPRMKQRAVQRHGGSWVEVALEGDSYSVAAQAAQAQVQADGRTFIPPYDDLVVMGGQGTLADEVVMSGRGPFDVAYLQIGGGGMAAAVACWLKRHYPDIRIVGVEGVDQACMTAAFEAGEPVTLPYVDVFCDGTAVKRAGDLTYQLCRELLDEIITVTNEEVCAAVQVLWEGRRCIPEPAGAMGLAGLMLQADQLQGKKALCILCGSNMDFGQLAWIARHAGIGAARRRYWRFEISEASGTLLELLETFLPQMNIVEFQYGKTDPQRAWPVLGIEASAPEFALLRERMQEHGISCADVTSRADVEFRVINYEPDLFHLPYFIRLEFPERPGALLDFLTAVRGVGSICYFNYVYTGEQVGRALLGFEFKNEDQRAAFQARLRTAGHVYHEVEAEVLTRML